MGRSAEVEPEAPANCGHRPIAIGKIESDGRHHSTAQIRNRSDQPDTIPPTNSTATIDRSGPPSG